MRTYTPDEINEIVGYLREIMPTFTDEKCREVAQFHCIDSLRLHYSHFVKGKKDHEDRLAERIKSHPDYSAVGQLTSHHIPC